MFLQHGTCSRFRGRETSSRAMQVPQLPSLRELSRRQAEKTVLMFACWSMAGCDKRWGAALEWLSNRNRSTKLNCCITSCHSCRLWSTPRDSERLACAVLLESRRRPGGRHAPRPTPASSFSHGRLAALNHLLSIWRPPCMCGEGQRWGQWGAQSRAERRERREGARGAHATKYIPIPVRLIQEKGV